MMRPEDRYDSLIRYYAELDSLDWLMVKAQIKQESYFNPDARSPAGALGLMQFMPRTWLEWQDGTPGIQEVVNMLNRINQFDPEDSIKAGCSYMRWLLKQFNQDQRMALAAYNWGIGNLKRLLAQITTGQVAWISRLPKETANYLVKINTYYVQYQHEQRQRQPT